MRIKALVTGTLIASFCFVLGMASGFAGEKQKYQFMVFSNAESGKESHTSSGTKDSTFTIS
jgi:hypothetical protein